MNSYEKIAQPVLHPCQCKAYNGGQCYNCLNGAHDICQHGCKRRRAKKVGLTLVFKGGKR